MSDSTNYYDRTLAPGDIFEFVKSVYRPNSVPEGTRGVIKKPHAVTGAVYFDFLDSIPAGYPYVHEADRAAYMCCMRRVDDSASFVPEDWS